MERKWIEELLGINPNGDSPSAARSTNKIARDKSTFTVQDIHRDFKMAVDELLVEAERDVVVDETNFNKPLINKANKLTALGFSSARTVQESQYEQLRYENALEVSDRAAKRLDAIRHFNRKYPQYKLITVAAVKTLCNKYGLVYGAASLYVGDIPDKNLADLESMKIDENDDCYFIDYYTERMTGKFDSVLTKTRSEYMDHRMFADTPHIDRHFRRDQKGKCELEIVANAKDFNMDDTMLQEFEITRIMTVPDPIVLKPVHYGGEKYYLIITAWGDEASDAAVVNEKMN